MAAILFVLISWPEVGVTKTQFVDFAIQDIFDFTKIPVKCGFF